MVKTFFRNLSLRIFGRVPEPAPSGSLLLMGLRGAFGVIVIGLAYVAFEYFADQRRDWPGGGASRPDRTALTRSCKDETAA